MRVLVVSAAAGAVRQPVAGTRTKVRRVCAERREKRGRGGDSSPRNSHRAFAVVVPTDQGGDVSILWIILIVVVVLALLGFFSRGVW
jgi:hypothetical protein